MTLMIMVMVMVTMWMILTRVMIEPQWSTLFSTYECGVSVFRHTASLSQQNICPHLLAPKADPEVGLGGNCSFGDCAAKNK